MKDSILGCFLGALTGIQAGAEDGGESLNEVYSSLEKSMRACIRFYQQGKIKGEARLIDYFENEHKERQAAGELDALGAAVVLGMSFERESSFQRMLSLCEKWEIEDSKDKISFAMMAGILSGITRGEKFKQSVNWAMGQFFETEGNEELTEVMKLVVALYESRKSLDKTVNFISDDTRFYKAFGASILVVLRKNEDLQAAVDCAYSNSAAGKLASVPTGAMIGALVGFDGIKSIFDQNELRLGIQMDMANDLYNIIYNDAILPFDKYAPL